MSTELTATAEIVSRDEVVYDDLDGGMRLSRVQITRAFRGDIDGESSANLMLAQPDGAFVAQERFTGTIGGRKGTVVLHHGRVNSATGQLVWGVIVSGSGTDELAGIEGTARLTFEGNKSWLTIHLSE